MGGAGAVGILRNAELGGQRPMRSARTLRALLPGTFARLDADGGANLTEREAHGTALGMATLVTSLENHVAALPGTAPPLAPLKVRTPP